MGFLAGRLLRRALASTAMMTLLAIVPSAGGGVRTPPSPPPRVSVAPVRYRPTGCVARLGALAYRHGPPRKLVALTFDDGPSVYTERFVRMLKANDAVATFFMIGEQLGGSYRAVLREELRDGDALGDHTWSHPNLLAMGGVRGQLQRTLLAIRGLSGYTPCIFRPPYGAYDAAVVRAARALGLATIMWSVDPSDYTLPGVATIARRVLAAATPGAIVISHDGGGPRAQTLAAYPAIIAALRARGYRFVTVPELLGFRLVYRRCRAQCQESEIPGRPPAGAIVQPG